MAHGRGKRRKVSKLAFAAARGSQDFETPPRFPKDSPAALYFGSGETLRRASLDRSLTTGTVRAENEALLRATQNLTGESAGVLETVHEYSTIHERVLVSHGLLDVAATAGRQILNEDGRRQS